MPIIRWDGTVWKDVLALVVPPGGGDPYADALAAREALVYGQPSAFPVANTSTGILPTSTCGLLDPSVLTAYNSPTATTVTLPDGAVIQDKIIGGDIHPPSTHNTDIVLRNCLLLGGPNNPSGAEAVINCGSNRGGTGRIKAYDCEIRPQRPAINRDGIRGNRVEFHRGWICDVTDGFSAYASTTTNSGNAYAYLLGSIIERLRYWNPDYSDGVSATPYHSDGSHNDNVALNGGKNIGVKGNLLKGTSVDGAPGQLTNQSHPDIQASGYSYGALVLFVNTVNNPMDLSVVVEENWFYGGAAHLNVKPNMVATVRNNRHYRATFVDPTTPVTNKGTWARYDNSVGNGVFLTTDTWIDGPYAGQVLTTPRDRGIQYNDILSTW